MHRKSAIRASEAQGNGFAQEACTGLIGQLFFESQRWVFADCHPDNLRSVALLERLGFTLDDRLGGKWHTHIGIR